MLAALLVLLGLTALFYLFVLLRAAIAQRIVPGAEAALLGAVTNFFDTLGIGSFAPSTAWVKFRHLLPDKLIPSTLLVGHTGPSIMQGIIFLLLLGADVDPVLLVGCILSLLAGALLGAQLVTRAAVWLVQLTVALGLVIAATIFLAINLHLMPGGGSASTLPFPLMLLAFAVNFTLGVLVNFGIGNYAPTLIMFSLMGMDPRYAFPVMAGSAAIAGAGASISHIRIGEIDLKVVTGIILGGLPAVLVAAFVVKNMDVAMLRWLVIGVVYYAAAVMARSAWTGHQARPSAA
ncbi:TSUP family transporter [Novosphingobium sp.]|uniref:TSUP family transporter n=1 Tax=Novosphingobium sp. TaxID=1874826 RepID=UPI0026324841|nr:TSUP family transporter [Novosphingobium sp.]